MNHHTTRNWLLITTISVLTFFTGCSDKPDTKENNNNNVTKSVLPENLFLKTAPKDPLAIVTLKQFAKEGDEVVVQVIVGGRMKPIVEGRASASIIDAGLDNECLGDGDHCETPWDYCCTTQEAITANLATLQVIDKDGRVIQANLSKHIKPMSKLIVRGIVGPRPDSKVLQINATGIYVQPASK